MSTFTQMVVWPGTIVGPESVEKFVSFMKTEFDANVKYVEEILTKPDLLQSEESGGRNDLFFLVASEDIPKFAIKRFHYGMRWLEDVLDNQEFYTPGYSIYPDRVKTWRTW